MNLLMCYGAFYGRTYVLLDVATAFSARMCFGVRGFALGFWRVSSTQIKETPR